MKTMRARSHGYKGAKKAKRPMPMVKRMALTRDEAWVRARATLGEHFEDFLIVARVRNPDEVWHATSDKCWATGAISEVMDRFNS
jgi:hypothetical protein